MKSIRSVLKPLSAGSLFTLITLASASGSLAQTIDPPEPLMPVVFIRATDPNASWRGDAGVFTVFREGPTNASLNLFYRIGGSASNGIDYGQIPNWISIAAGERTNAIIIKPIAAGQTVSKTVELQLAYPPTMPPINYQIGSASNAMVVIRAPDPTNLPPVVSIASPTNGTVFPPEAEVLMCADARDADGYVSTVEFFAGTQSLGIRTNNPMSAGPMNPFCLVWSNVPPGAYVLTAKATDNAGATSVSPPVRVQVMPPALPVVSVLATDPNASEPGLLTVVDAGGFTIFRDHGTNEPMQVFYSLRGSASNGVDYVRLSNSVVIPAGALSARVVVNPLMDKLVEGTETVGLRLEPVVCAAIYPPPPGCYQVGNPSEAVVSIADSNIPPATNQPPLVRISSPPDNAVFRAPVDIPLFAYARDADDAVAAVEFFAGTKSLGFGQAISTRDALPAGTAYPTNSYMLVWSNAPLGAYTLTAKATDQGGAFSISEPVRISVLTSPPPPPTNRLASVSIVATDPIAIEGTNCWIWRGVTNPQPSWASWSAASFRFFTNCGPKNATFAVHRFGDTNSALSVGYEIGGTATNGVDYLPLSGVVTFQAGERSVLLTVVPIDDGSPEINRTVILKLRPSRQVPPEYLVGSPAGAAAIILDSNRPRPVSGLLSDKSFHVNAAGPDGAWFRVEYSLNMLDWTAICTNQVINGSIDFIDPEAQNDQCRFYRTVPESGPAQ